MRFLRLLTDFRSYCTQLLPAETLHENFLFFTEVILLIIIESSNNRCSVFIQSLLKSMQVLTDDSRLSVRALVNMANEHGCD